MTTKKPREFVLHYDPTDGSLDTIFEYDPELMLSAHDDFVIHVQEVLPDPTDEEIETVGKKTYDEFLLRYHEKPDFAEAYLMGFRAALAWMKGER
jgi:hypothetical protein